MDGQAAAELERLLLDGAQAAGFLTDLWTCRRVAQAIEERFGVRYPVDHIGRLMRCMRWNPQKPATVNGKNCAY